MSASENVPVGICASKRLRAVSRLFTLEPPYGEPFGVNKDGQPARAGLSRVSLRQMLDTQAPTHQHFTTYTVDELDRWPRISKTALGQVRAQRDVTSHMVVLDWDLHHFFQSKDKIPWAALSEQQATAVDDLLRRAGEALTSQEMPWNIFYTTPHGCRFIHVLAFPVPTGPGFERFYMKMLDTYAAAGLDCDESCRDWTRLFAAPRVTLPNDEGTETGKQDWFRIEEQWEHFLVPDEMGADDVEALVVEVNARDVPDRAACRDQIEVMQANGRMGLTEAAKKAKRILRDDNSLAYAYLFENKKLDAGQHHNQILSIIGSAIGLCYGYQWFSEDLLFGLLEPVLAQLDANGIKKAWEMVQTFCAQEQARIDHKRQEIEDRQHDVEPDGRAGFFQGVRSWLPGAETLTDSELLKQIRDRRLGVAAHRHRNNYFVLGPDGYYSPFPSALDRLPLDVRGMGMDWLVPIESYHENDRGEMIVRPLSPDRIREQSATLFKEERVSLGGQGCFLSWPNKTSTFNLVPFALRQDLPAEFNADVDEWLRLLVPDDRVEEFLQAVAYTLAIYSGPTAAISLIGAPGSGKKMLALGLAECFTNQEAVPGDVMVVRFNQPLLRSPIIWVDEGVGAGDRDFADVFRRIVTGGPLAIERKQMDIIQMSGVHRVIITANNTELLARLSSKRARSQYDWEAIGERLIHFPIQERATTWLRERGGLEFTEGWIEGDTGAPSQEVVARHLMWLYKNLPREDGVLKRQGRRLLFEGTSDAPVLMDLESEAGNVPEIACAINNILRRNVRSSSAVPAMIDGVPSVGVLSRGIIDYAVENYKLKPAAAREALRSLYRVDDTDRRLVLDGRQARWKIIDAVRLANIVERHTVLAASLATLLGWDVVSEAERATDQ